MRFILGLLFGITLGFAVTTYISQRTREGDDSSD